MTDAEIIRKADDYLASYRRRYGRGLDIVIVEWSDATGRYLADVDMSSHVVKRRARQEGSWMAA